MRLRSLASSSVVGASAVFEQRPRSSAVPSISNSISVERARLESAGTGTVVGKLAPTDWSSASEASGAEFPTAQHSNESRPGRRNCALRLTIVMGNSVFCPRGVRVVDECCAERWFSVPLLKCRIESQLHLRYFWRCFCDVVVAMANNSSPIFQRLQAGSADRIYQDRCSSSSARSRKHVVV